MNARFRIGRARDFVLASAACGVLLLGVAASASAGTLDQQQAVGSGDARVGTDESLAQTFTAGLTGGLDRIDLLLGSDGSGPTVPLTVEIRSASSGPPGPTVLATGSVPPSAVSLADAWTPITFATAVPVTAGTQYAIVAYSSVDMANSYFWGLEFDNPYPAGANFFQTVSPPDGPWTLTALDGDQAFKTYVAVPASPAPPPDQPAPKHKKCKKHKKKHRSAVPAKKGCHKKKHH
jgi:hypothetical protein